MIDATQYPLLAALCAKYGVSDPGMAYASALHRATLGDKGASRDLGALDMARGDLGLGEKELARIAAHDAAEKPHDRPIRDGSAIPKI